MCAVFSRICAAAVMMLEFGPLRGPAMAADSVGRVLTGERLSIRLECSRALDRGLAWLERAQAEDGSWGRADVVGRTAQALIALQSEPVGTKPLAPARARAIRLGADFLLGQQDQTGAFPSSTIWSNDATAAAVLALGLRRHAGDRPALERAALALQRSVMAGSDTPTGPSRIAAGASAALASPGVMGWDLFRAVAVLEGLRFGPRGEEALNGALRTKAMHHLEEFVQACQHRPGNAEPAWVSVTPRCEGGFVFHPRILQEHERGPLLAYGDVTLGGLLGLAYSGRGLGDRRVDSALAWVRRNYTLSENPNLGAEGRYRYYGWLTQALTLLDIDQVETSEGRPRDWRIELGLVLIDLQDSDGSWSNPCSRDAERDSVVATAWAVTSMGRIMRGL